MAAFAPGIHILQHKPTLFRGSIPSYLKSRSVFPLTHPVKPSPVRQRLLVPCLCTESNKESESKTSSKESSSSSAETLLNSSDYIERIRGVNRVGEITQIHEQVAALLPLASKDPNGQVRFCALSHLASLSGDSLDADDARSILETIRYVLVNDKDSSCVSGAADVIAGLKLQDGFDDLVKAFKESSDWMLRFTIAAGMGELAHPSAYEFLTEILKSTEQEDSLLYTAAIGALGDLGDKRAIPVIEGFRDSNDFAVKERAGIALAMLKDG